MSRSIEEEAELSAAKFAKKLSAIRASLRRPSTSWDGRQVGDYQIVEKIGHGGDASVYRAQSLQTGEACAIKLLHAAESQDKGTARFQREALVLEKLHHPNIVRLISFGVLGDQQGYFLVTELLKGKNLKQHMEREESFSLTRISMILSQICDALHYAHQQGIFHRDIKPENIFLEQEDGEPERVKLIDFGIAGLAESEDELTQVGMHVGTPHYMSPEQALGQARDATARSDLYSLGVVLYELLTGALPFESSNPTGMIYHHAYTPPPRLLDAFPHKPWSPLLDTFLERVLAKLPQHRPADAMGFLADCEKALASQQRLLEGPLMASGNLTYRGFTQELQELTAADLLEEPDSHISFFKAPGLAEGELPEDDLPTLPGEDLYTLPTEEVGVLSEMVEPSDAFGSEPARTELVLTPLSPKDFLQFKATPLPPPVSLPKAPAGEPPPEPQPVKEGPSLAFEAPQPTSSDSLEILERDTHIEELETPGPLASLRLQKNNLPEQELRLFGREAALAHMEAHFGQGSRLLCLTGPGGIGKSRLMQRFGQLQLAAYPGGVWYCDLALAESLSGLCRRIARGMGVPLTQGNEVIQLGNAIRGRGPCLLLLDHCEGLAGFFSQTVALWMQRSSGVHFAMASCEPFPLEHEDILELQGLHPEPTRRAFLAKADEQPPSLEAEMLLMELCKALAGVPLAVELAACSGLSPKQLLADLGSAGAMTDPITGVVQLLWPTLSSDEKRALHHCAAFGGCFSLDALRRVLQLPKQPKLPLLLAQLLRKGWLQPLDHGERLRLPGVLLSWIRARPDFGLDALIESERSFGVFYASYGALDALQTRQLQGAARRYGLWLEQGELHQALEWAMARQESELAAQIFLALASLSEDFGPLAESIELGRWVLKASSGWMPALRASLQWALGRLLARAGQPDEAHGLFDMALILARQAGHRRLEGMLLTEAGGLAMQTGQRQLAQQHYRDALSLHQAVRNRFYEALTLQGLGMLRVMEGQADEAEGLYLQALALHRQLGAHREEAQLCGLLGTLLALKGDFDSSLRHYAQAFAMAQRSDDWLLEGQTLNNQGGILLERGQQEEARILLEAALTLSQELGDRKSEGSLLGHLGRLCIQQGRSHEASLFFEEAIHAAREVGNPMLMGLCHGQLGELLLAEQPDAAHAHLGQAILTFKKLQSHLEGIYLGSMAELMVSSGQLDKAASYLERGEQVLRASNDAQALSRLLGQRGMFELASGRPELAQTLLDQARSLARGAQTDAHSPLTQTLGRLQLQLDANATPFE